MSTGPGSTGPGSTGPASTGPASLHEILDLEQIEDLMFRGRSRGGTTVRVFGGEVAAQALVAAGRTVPADRHVHSLHAYFLRPGDPARPLLYQVDPMRDGGSFTTRRVVAVQHGEAVFHLSASFHTGSAGFEHQTAHLVAPGPEDLPPGEREMGRADPLTRAWFDDLLQRFPLDIRFPEELPRVGTVRGERAAPRQRIWVRASQGLPDDPLVHACAATYASDLFLLATALPPHGAVIGDPHLQFASLDHAVWFHAPFRADDWLLYEQEAPWAGQGGRWRAAPSSTAWAPRSRASSRRGCCDWPPASRRRADDRLTKRGSSGIILRIFALFLGQAAQRSGTPVEGEGCACG